MINWELTEKQTRAWDYLQNKETVEILFGGAAGGGKTHFLCCWAVDMCLEYSGVRGFLGRNSLEDFKKSTLLTLFEIMSNWGLKKDKDYTHNQQDKVFHFLKSGSDLYYGELSFYPSDPNYNYLGSTEYTFAGIDEANQVRKKAKNILRTRIRFKLKKYGLIPKLLMSCNPDKGYLYTDFYKPSRNGKLPVERAFVQALAGDNPYNDPSYVKNLIGLDDPITKQRLLYGNWEYDDDPTKMINYEAITDLFSNVVIPDLTKKYIP